MAKSSIELRVNKKKLESLVNIVLEMMHNKKPPFNSKSPFPDAIVPQGIIRGSRDHALYLFYGCSLDSRQRAEDVYKGMRGFARDTDLFTLHTLNKEELGRLIRKNFKNPETSKAIEATFTNSRILKDKYSGDPRRIHPRYLVQSTYEELLETYKRLDEFAQLQNGVGKAALLVKNYVRFEIWRFDPTQIYVKVDVHLNRIGLANAIDFYKGEEKVPASEVGYVRQERVVKVLTPAILELTREKRISAVNLDDALWLLGSKLCNLNRHSSCRSFCDIKCPIRPQLDDTKSSLDPGRDCRIHYGIQRKSYDPSQKTFDFL